MKYFFARKTVDSGEKKKISCLRINENLGTEVFHFCIKTEIYF